MALVLKVASEVDGGFVDVITCVDCCSTTCGDVNPFVTLACVRGDVNPFVTLAGVGGDVNRFVTLAGVRIEDTTPVVSFFVI